MEELNSAAKEQCLQKASQFCMVPLSSPVLHFAEEKPWVHISFQHRYAAEVLADTKSFQEQLTNEMSEWIEKHCDDESVPEVSLSEFLTFMGKKQSGEED